MKSMMTVWRKTLPYVTRGENVERSIFALINKQRQPFGGIGEKAKKSSKIVLNIHDQLINLGSSIFM